MEKKSDRTNMLGRRRALQVIGAGIGAATGLVGIGGCTKSGDGGAGPGGNAPARPAGLCQDRVPIDDTARTMRRTLQYKEKSDTPEKKCSLCAQFEAGKYGDCGGCKLFAGGVHPDGVCLSFAPLQAPGAGGAPAQAPPAAPAPAKGG